MDKTTAINKYMGDASTSDSLQLPLLETAITFKWSDQLENYCRTFGD